MGWIDWHWTEGGGLGTGGKATVVVDQTRSKVELSLFKDWNLFSNWRMKVVGKRGGKKLIGSIDI